MSLDPLGQRPRIAGASTGRRPVERTGVRSIYAKINLTPFVLSQEIGAPTREIDSDPTSGSAAKRSSRSGSTVLANPAASRFLPRAHGTDTEAILEAAARACLTASQQTE
jgi:hypothetical protein